MQSVSKREFHVENAPVYNRASPVRWILSHIGRNKLLLFLFALGIIGTNYFNSGIQRQLGIAFDQILNKDGSGLLTIALLLVGFVLLRTFCDIGGQFSMEVIAKRLERNARDELYLNLLGKSQTFHNRQRIGDIMARATNDVREMNNMMMPGIALMADSMMGVVVPIVFIGTIDWRLLLAPLLFVVAFYFSLRHYMQQLNPVSNSMRQSFGEMNARLAETIAGIEVVKTAAQEEQELRTFIKNARSYRNFFVMQGQVQARYLPPLFLGFSFAVAFLHGLFLFYADQLSIGDLVAYLGLMGLLRFPSFISIFTFALIQLGVVGASRVLHLMDQETEIDENEQAPSTQVKGQIEFDNVSFGYGDGHLILKNLNFSAAPGETVAIVGQTGSGKSTLTRLVNRTYDATTGRILIDGQDVTEWNLSALRAQISTIEQDIFLFSRSIADNIAFGQKNATREAIESAAKDAQAHDFISGFQDGYDTVIGERGVTLSGGQRQRLAIARALLTDPRILIIDDATSAIDSATEDRIQRAIDRVLEGRTTLLITHRLSQIRRADRILVLRQGEIIDQGTHDELVERCDLYRRIFLRNQTA